MGLEDIGITTLTYQGHVTSSAIGHLLLVGRVIDAKPLSQTVFEIFASKYN